MSEQLRRVLLIGASLGLASQISAMLPEPKPAKQITPDDLRRIAAAERKRLKRQARNKRHP